MTHILAAEQLIIDRLITETKIAVTTTDPVTHQPIVTMTATFKTIDNPSLIAGLHDIGPYLPACFVMPGAADINAQQPNGAGVVEEQDWHLIIIVAHQAFTADDKLTEARAGVLMQSCIKALHFWKPDDTNFFRTFTYTGRAEPEYNLGYAEFPLTFKIRRMIIA
jgi:hypothetical protein